MSGTTLLFGRHHLLRSPAGLAGVATALVLLLLLSGGLARGGDFVVLAKGTPVVVKVTEDLDPSVLDEGDTPPLAVAEKVKRERHTLISADAPVSATVVPGAGKDDGVKLLRIVSTLAVDGQEVLLNTSPQEPGGGTSAGSLVPLPLPLPAGTTFKVYLSESYYIEE